MEFENLFTGWKDPDLTEQGIGEAKEAGRNQGQGRRSTSPSPRPCARPAYAGSDARRDGSDRTATTRFALNERDYGDLSGLNKDDARAKWGEEQVLIWRRCYDVPPPGGESLKDTLARTLPYYVRRSCRRAAGERTLIAAHGNSLRALIMVLEGLSPEQILKRELGTGEPRSTGSMRIRRCGEARSGGVN